MIDVVEVAGRAVGTVALVDLAVTAQVADNAEWSTAARVLANKGLLASVAVHVCLERAGAGEALVANAALVLLLGGALLLRAELAHHRLRCRRLVNARGHGTTNV